MVTPSNEIKLFDIDTYVLNKLIERVTKLNVKAIKQFGLSEPVTEIEIVNRYHKPAKTGFGMIQVCDVVVTKAPPFIEGWEFRSKIDFSLGTDFPVVSGAELPESIDKNSCKCNHCGVNRERHTVYVLRKVETGEHKVVGSSCLKNFFETDPTAYLNAWDINIQDEVDALSESMGSGKHLYDPRVLLAITHRIAETYGFKSVSQAQATDTLSTAFYVGEYLHRPTLVNDLGLYDETDLAVADEAMGYVLSQSDTSNYINNLKSLLSAPYVHFEHINTVVSAMGSYYRYKANLYKSDYKKEYIGTEKDKLETTVTVESIKPIESYYGLSYLVRMVDESKHLLTWFASKKPDMEVGNSYTVKGTIKKHDRYKEEFKTVLTRVKVIAQQPEGMA